MFKGLRSLKSALSCQDERLAFSTALVIEVKDLVAISIFMSSLLNCFVAPANIRKMWFHIE